MFDVFLFELDIWLFELAELAEFLPGILVMLVIIIIIVLPVRYKNKFGTISTGNISGKVPIVTEISDTKFIVSKNIDEINLLISNEKAFTCNSGVRVQIVRDIRSNLGIVKVRVISGDLNIGKEGYTLASFLTDLIDKDKDSE